MVSGQLYRQAATTEQLYRQRGDPHTADSGTGVLKVPAITASISYIFFAPDTEF